jgi:hypothetical protein
VHELKNRMFPAEVGNVDHRQEDEAFQRSKAELFAVFERRVNKISERTLSINQKLAPWKR